MLDTLRTAIESRRTIRLDYEPGLRLVEPHALGYGSDGQILLRAYEVEGASASGEHANWKLFRIDRAGSAHPSGETFVAPRPGYKKNDKAMKGGIIAQL